MAYCPQCHAEYRDGVEICKSCGGVALVAELPRAQVLSSEDDTLPVSLTRESQNPVEFEGRVIDPSKLFILEHAKEVEFALQEAGYPTMLVPLEEIVFPDQRVRFEVHVRSEDFERVQSFLDQRWQDALSREGAAMEHPADLESCPACGGRVPANVAECPECGLVVGMAEGEEEEGGV